jgi:hypothetical protein
MRRARIAGCCCALASILAAQETAVLRNDGQPIHVLYACTPENLDWAGLACADDDPCSIYLELNAIASAGKKVFLAGDLHAQAATLASILLASDDGGLTWKEPAARMRGAALDQFQFYNAEHGWASGETVYPLARDPLFLITGDGGESWRNRAVTDEGGPGSIQRFVFDSPQHGELLVDGGKGAEGGRYKRYESDTGGDSWSIRSATEAAPKMPDTSAADPDYRISSGKDVYRIEKRTGGKWSSFVVFAVNAATCKAPVQTESAPPEAASPDAQPKEPQ